MPRNGLPLGEMSPEQRRLALALLRASSSPSGYRKAVDIMALQGVLQRMSPGIGDTFDADRYYVSVFGTPGAARWGWRFEGHHLSRHFTVVRGTLVAEPFFLGAWPTRAGSAYRSVARGDRTMPREEDAAREIVLSLDGRLRRQVVFSSESLTDHVTQNAARVRPLDQVGVVTGDLPSAAQKRVLEILRTYLANHPGRWPATRFARIERAGLARTTFGWAGSTRPGVPHYYRLQGPTFLLEFDNSRDSGTHIHSVWRDFERDFGRHLLVGPGGLAVTEFQRYLAEEVAEDHADGLVSRREALRRLGLLGLTGAAAASLLAAAVAAEAKALTGRASGRAAAADRAADVAALPTREITFRGPRGRQADRCVGAARRPRGGVLVIHENRGLTDSIRTVAGRLAASGYSSLAIDLLSDEGGTKSFADEFEAMAALGAWLRPHASSRT